MAPLSGSSSFSSVVAWVIGFINLVIPVLTLLALVLFLYSGYRYIIKSGETQGKGREREALLWGIVALFVLFSVWGLLRIICNTLVGSDSCREGAVSEPMNIIPQSVR